FYWAGGLILILLGAMAVILIRKVAGWLLSLPIVLFEDQRPAAAIKDSQKASFGHRRELAGWLVAWLAVGALASVVTTWLIGSLGRFGVSLAGDSIQMTAFTIGAVGVLTLAANALVSIFAAALFALVAVHVYRRYSGPGALPDQLADGGEIAARTGSLIPRKWLLAGGAGVILVALGATWTILSRVKMEDEVLIIAHRGSAATAPENTLAAVREAVEAGADFVEIDVQETADGEVVVFHDGDFMKTAGEAMKIWEARRADLDRIDIGSWFDKRFSAERTPTLAQVLQECKGRSKVNIELKYYGHDEDLEQRVIDIVEAEGMGDQVVVMSLKYDKVQKTKAKRPDWTYGLLTTVQLGDISKFDVDFLGVSAAGASRSFVRNAKSKGFDVYVWTVNDPFQMSSMISRGVDGIITDEPALARRTLELRAGLNPIERLLIGIGTEVGVFSLPDKLPTGDDA
ncbi:MAG: glycerophosphodiester phosphodiesterase, partial [Verrucomicrobiales bacterium]